jgi:hypothetical protein
VSAAVGFLAISLAIPVSIGLLARAGRAQPPEDAPVVRPITSLWLTSPPTFPGTSERDAAYTKGLKEWRQVFDAFMLLKLPPTFSDEEDFTARANALIKEAGGQFVIVTLPVGDEGWESSANQRLAQRQQRTGGHYDAGKAMPQLQWLATLKDLDAGGKLKGEEQKGSIEGCSNTVPQDHIL